jgi:hypothetical protein
MLVHRKLFRLNIILAIFFKLFKELIDIARSRAMNAGYYVKKFDPPRSYRMLVTQSKSSPAGWLAQVVGTQYVFRRLPLGVLRKFVSDQQFARSSGELTRISIRKNIPIWRITVGRNLVFASILGKIPLLLSCLCKICVAYHRNA